MGISPAKISDSSILAIKYRKSSDQNPSKPPKVSQKAENRRSIGPSGAGRTAARNLTSSGAVVKFRPNVCGFTC